MQHHLYYLDLTLIHLRLKQNLQTAVPYTKKYYSEFFTGAQDPRELIKTIEKELETAGWETIRAEAQKQIDAAK